MSHIESIPLPRSMEQLDEKWASPQWFEEVIFECRQSHQWVLKRNERCVNELTQTSLPNHAEELIFVRCSWAE
jgi:hypothetical protein